MLQLIQTATLCQQQEVRKQAEAQLIQMRVSDPIGFIDQTLQTFLSPATNNMVRKGAGAILVTSILHKVDPTPLGYLWCHIPPEAREALKAGVLQILIDPEKNIRRSAADIISAICAIEIPTGQWPNILSTICSSTTHQDSTIRDTALITLGFICERLAGLQAYVPPIDSQLMLLETLLTALKVPAATKTALKALNDSIQLFSVLRDQQQAHNVLVKELAALLIRKTQDSFEVIQVLTEVAHYYYGSLAVYLNDLFELLKPLLQNKGEQERTNIAVIEFWQTLAHQYGSLTRKGATSLVNFVDSNLGIAVLEQILLRMCGSDAQESEFDDQDELYASGSRCLTSLFECSVERFRASILTFTSSYIRHQDPKYRRVTLTAFATWVSCANPESVQDLVNSSLLEFLGLLKDNSQLVRSEVLRSVALMAESVPQCFLQHPNFVNILQLVVAQIQPKYENRTASVCQFLRAIAFQVEQKKLDVLKPVLDDLLTFLLKQTIDKDCTSHTVQHLFFAFVELLSASQAVQLLQKYLGVALDTLDNLKETPFHLTGVFAESFFLVVQNCLTSFQKMGMPLNPQQLDRIYSSIVREINRERAVTSSTLYAASVLLYECGQHPKYLQDFWKYVNSALQRPVQIQLYSAALNAVSALIYSYKSAMVSVLEPHLTKMVLVFQDTKLSILGVFGELILQCGHLVSFLLASIQAMLQVMIYTAVEQTQQQTNDYQTINERVISSSLCVYRGFNPEVGPKTPQLVKGVPLLINMIKETTNRKYKPKINYIRNCVWLMADIAKVYKNEVRPLLKQKEVFQCMEILKKHANDKNTAQCLAHAKKFI